jgi:hypothetical protein
VAELVTQSNLLSGGVEDRFVAYLFADSNEIDRIRHLELCANIKILPENFEPIMASGIKKDAHDDEPEDNLIDTSVKPDKVEMVEVEVDMPKPKLPVD